MKKIIISVAPVAANADSISPDKLADEIVSCSKAGAAMVHLHAKGPDGKLTKDISLLEQVFKTVREKSDIVFEASTGGISNLTIEERCAPLNCGMVEMASLNCGSCNLGEAVYHNSLDEIRYCSKQITVKKIRPDFEMFEIGMINTMQKIGEKIKFEKPMVFNIVLGQDGVMPATVEALAAFRHFLPSGSLWGITHYNRRDFVLIQAALTMDVSIVRVGFEDSVFLDKNMPAPDNLAQVQKISQIIREMGMEPATPEEARQILGLRAI